MLQPGSLVVIKKNTVKQQYNSIVVWLPIMDEETPYTIRHIQPDPGDTTQILVFLEEGVIGYVPNTKRELGMPIEMVIEIQPPMDISELIEESIYVPVERDTLRVKSDMVRKHVWDNYSPITYLRVVKVKPEDYYGLG